MCLSKKVIKYFIQKNDKVVENVDKKLRTDKLLFLSIKLLQFNFYYIVDDMIWYKDHDKA